MPVPDYMLDAVQGHRADLDAANDAAARAAVAGVAAPMTFGLSYLAAPFIPDSFMKPLADSFVGNWGRDLFGHFTAWWDDWSGQMTAKARQIYSTADHAYKQSSDTTSAPTSADSRSSVTDTPLTFGGGTGGGAGGVGGLGAGTSGIGAPKSFPPTGSGYGGLPHTGTGTGTGVGTGGPGSGFGDYTPPPPTGSLAGAGGGGLSGLGGGGAGLGGLGGGLGGLGGGAGGLGGLGGPPVGTPVSPPAMSMPPGFGGMGGAGAAGRRAASASSGRGAYGAGGHGGHGGGEGDEHYTWLAEDEDVWGGGDAPPDLLR
jgi:hypothetical protein